MLMSMNCAVNGSASGFQNFVWLLMYIYWTSGIDVVLVLLGHLLTRH